MKKEVELKKKGKLKMIDEEDENLKIRIISNKLRSHEFNDSEKILEIQRQNQKMMQNLYDISKGKHSSLKHLLGDDNYQVMVASWQNYMMEGAAVENEVTKSVMMRNSQMKSLHLPYRKKEAQRIDDEN
jgi:inorganic pyrophosphatase